MATTSKSPARVVREALIIARRTLPAYAHRFSPKKFTQHQLFACLVLKELLRIDYRGVVVLLRESVSLRDELGLHAAPDYSTLQKASRRLLSGGRAQRLLDETLQRARRQRRRLTAVLRPTSIAGKASWLIRQRASLLEPVPRGALEGHHS